MSVEITRWVNNGGQVESQEWSLIDGDNTTVTENAGAKTIQIDASGGGGSGTVTSVSVTVPTGLAVSGSPVTTSGTIAITLDTGYAIPTTTAIANAATAFGWGNHASAGYLTSSAIDSLAELNAIVGVTLIESTNAALTDARTPTAHAASHVNGTDDIQSATAAQKGLMTATAMSKLDGIEAGADVTDTANVTAAGALMDSELTDLAGVKGVTISTLQPKPSEGAFANGDKTKLDGIATGANNYTHPNHSGDVTSSGDGVQTIAAGAVDLAMLSATGTASASTFLRGDNTWATPAGSGDFVGPASADDDAVVIFDGTTGKLGRNSDIRLTGFGTIVADYTSVTIAILAGGGKFVGTSTTAELQSPDTTDGWRVADGALTAITNSTSRMDVTDSGVRFGGAGDRVTTMGTGVGAALAINVGTTGGMVRTGDNVSELSNDAGYYTVTETAADIATHAALTSSVHGISAFGATLVDDATASDARTTLGLAIGTHVQAYDADLTTWAGITPGANVGTALAIAVGSAGAIVTNGGALGTPSSGNGSNLTALNASQLTSGTLPAARLGADSIDAITEIATAIKSGADAKLITGTAGTAANLLEWNGDGDAVDSSWPAGFSYIGFACSDETTALTTGQKVAFDFPFGFVATRVYATVTTAPTGSALTVDVEDEGTTILNAVVSISASANNAETSTFAAAASTYTFSKGDLCTIDIDAIGSTVAGAGLKVFLIGYRTDL